MSATCDHDVAAHRHVICCLLALEIADFDARPVLDQIRLTHDFHSLLSDATSRTTSHDLVSMVDEDGALLGFLATPEECFTTALAIRDATLTQGRYPDLRLRIGISLGKAEIAADEFGKQHVSGEVRQDAHRLMRQGPPRQISVARQFVELLSRTAPQLAASLEYQGPYSDTVGPLLYLYQLPPPPDPGSPNATDRPETNGVYSRVIHSPTGSDRAPIAVPALSTASDRHRPRRSWLRYAFLLLLAGVGMAILSARFGPKVPILEPAEQVAAAPAQTSVPEAAQSLSAPASPQDMTPSTRTTPPVLANDSPGTPQPAASRRAEPRTKAAPAARRIEERVASKKRLERVRTARADAPPNVRSIQNPRRATVFLAIKPWGEVYVDGRKIGVAPPLKKLSLAPGRRLITITNSSLPSYQTQVVADAGAQVTLVHDFGCRSERDVICREGFGEGLQLDSHSGSEAVAARR